MAIYQRDTIGCETFASYKSQFFNIRAFFKHETESIVCDTSCAVNLDLREILEMEADGENTICNTNGRFV